MSYIGHYSSLMKRMLHIFCDAQLLSSLCYRYYSTLLQSLMDCDEETVEVVRSGLEARLGPDMLTLFQLLQKKPCPQGFGPSTAGIDGHEGFRWPMGAPMFKIQPDLHNREPNHLFAKKRSVEDKILNTLKKWFRKTFFIFHKYSQSALIYMVTRRLLF